ncbi:hypothetical protein BZA77DRAFT_283679 [Pyronema omphalodes]|nr:hypothetical protein BZA77DRAFT_283679 [Pyronema omphalodes]
MSLNIHDEWNAAVQKNKHRLRKPKYATLVISLDYDTFKLTLENKSQKYSQSKITRSINRLGGVFERLSRFFAAVTNVIQASACYGGAPAGFAWGCIMAVLTAAQQFSDVLEKVVQMFEDLTVDLLVSQDYIEIFPDNQVLRKHIIAIIGVYVDFSISMLKYLKRGKFVTLINCFWPYADKKFQKTREKIAEHRAKFESQCKLTFRKTILQGQREAQAQRDDVYIIPTPPEKLFIVPYPENPRLCGRESTLKLLHQQLSRSKNADSLDEKSMLSSVVHGMGGIGKTQVALGYTYKYRSSYDYIFWIRGETDPEISNHMEMIAKELYLCTDGDGTRVLIDKLKRWLENTDKTWLLVFDNIEDWSSLREYWPSSGRGSVLVTSQYAEISQLTRSEVRLEPLSDSAGAKLILNYLEGESEYYAKILTQGLGGLPLAITQVSGYMFKTGVSIEDTLTLLKERTSSARIFNYEKLATTWQYEKTLGVVWDASFEQLDHDSMSLLRILSMMSPDEVNENIVFGDHEEPELSFLKLQNIDPRRIEMIRTLTDRQLVQKEGRGKGYSYFRLHRCLCASVLHRLDQDFNTFDATFNMTFKLLRKLFPKQSPIQFPQNDLWADCELYSAHVMQLRLVYEGSKTPPTPSIGVAELFSDISNYFWERNFYGDGLRASDTAEKICEQLEGQYHYRRANVYTLAAAIRTGYGISERAGALHRFQKAVALRQEHMNRLRPNEVTVEDIINYAHAWSNMGSTLLDYDSYEDTLAYSNLAISIRMKLGPHRKKIKEYCFDSEKNKALSLAALGRFPEANELIPDESALPTEGRFFASLQIFHFLWANITLAAGNREGAFVKLQKVLENRKRLFGPRARSTLDTYYMLGVVEERRGNQKEGIQYFEQALELHRKENPGEEPLSEWSNEARARCQHHLAKLYRNEGLDEKAQKLNQMARETRDDLWKVHGKFKFPLVDRDSEDTFYDHIVPIEAGRPTLGNFHLPIVKSPGLNQICRLLTERIANIGSETLTPAELLHHLQYTDVPIPIEEPFVIAKHT